MNLCCPLRSPRSLIYSIMKTKSLFKNDTVHLYHRSSHMRSKQSYECVVCYLTPQMEIRLVSYSRTLIFIFQDTKQYMSTLTSQNISNQTFYQTLVIFQHLGTCPPLSALSYSSTIHILYGDKQIEKVQNQHQNNKLQHVSGRGT